MILNELKSNFIDKLQNYIKKIGSYNENKLWNQNRRLNKNK